MSKSPYDANITFFRKLIRIKKLFYPFVQLLLKIPYSESVVKPLNVFTRLFGIKRSITVFFNHKNFAKLFKNNFIKQSDTTKKLLFPVMFGSNSNYTFLSLLLAKFSITKNYSPVLLICDKNYSICTRERVGKTRINFPNLCNECNDGFRYIVERTGIQILNLSEYYTPDVISNVKKYEKEIASYNSIEEYRNFTLEDFEIGKRVEITVLRYLYRGEIAENPENLVLFKKYLLQSVKHFYIVKKILEKEKINYSIIQNGTLIFDSILRYHISKNDGKYITYENFIGANSIIYKSNDEVMNLNWNTEAIDYYKAAPALDDMESWVNSFFNNLKKGVGLYARLNEEGSKNLTLLNENFVCLFTNLNFDTAVLGKNTIFENMSNCIEETINFWRDKVKDTKLVVRIHPGELKLKTPSLDFINNFISKIDIPSNVIIIKPEEKISSYELINYMKFGIVYTSTIGLEISYYNKYCIVAGKAFYSDRNFVLTPTRKNEYFDIISDLLLNKLNFDINRKDLIRFIYFNYKERIKYFDGVNLKTPYGTNIYNTNDVNLLLKNNLDLLENIFIELEPN